MRILQILLLYAVSTPYLSPSSFSLSLSHDLPAITCLGSVVTFTVTGCSRCCQLARSGRERQIPINRTHLSVNMGCSQVMELAEIKKEKECVCYEDDRREEILF